MRFHDFEVEGGGGTKLEEWHSLAKMRPLAPPAHKPKPEAGPRQAGAAPSQPDGKKPKTSGCNWEYHRNQVPMVHSEDEIVVEGYLWSLTEASGALGPGTHGGS